MEWSGPLRNSEVRLDTLKFNQREELEALQLTNRQWRHSVHRYSPELALRPVKSVKLDLRDGSVFRLGGAEAQKHKFELSNAIPDDDPDEGEDDDDVKGDFESAEFDEKVRSSVKALMTTSNCARLNHCFIERLTLRRDDAASETVSIAFGKDFCVWIKALLELKADVHVQTLELVDPLYDKISMDWVYKLLDEVPHVQEYLIRKDGEADRGDELCVDVLKKAKRVTIIDYYLAEGDDEAEGQDGSGTEGAKNTWMNGCEKNVLDFVFNAPQCEELCIVTECDGSELPNKLIKRFQGLKSTSQMVATFTWQWCSEYDCDMEAWPEPIAVCSEELFKTVTHLRPKTRGKGLGEPARGYAYQFRNENDGSCLTVVPAPGDDRVMQFRKGKPKLDDASEEGLSSNAKKRRPNDVSTYRT